MNKQIIEYLKAYIDCLEDKLFFLNCKDMWNNDDYRKSHELNDLIDEVKRTIRYIEDETLGD